MGRDQNIKYSYNYRVPGWTNIITDKSIVRDQGVSINSDFTSSDHISEVYSKVSQRAGLLLRKLQNGSIKHIK